MKVGRYRKKPVIIAAMQWTADSYDRMENMDALNKFCGMNWSRADAVDAPWNHSDEEQVVVWNSLEQQWLCVPVGHWIICGLKGEFYPCEDSVFRATYEIE